MLELEKKENTNTFKFGIIKSVNRFIEKFPVVSLNLIIIGMSGGILLGIVTVTYTIYGLYLLCRNLFQF